MAHKKLLITACVGEESNTMYSIISNLCLIYCTDERTRNSIFKSHFLEFKKHPLTCCVFKWSSGSLKFCHQASNKQTVQPFFCWLHLTMWNSIQALGGTHLLKLRLFIQKLRTVFSEEGENTSEYLLTFGPINNTMVQGFAENQACLFVSKHLLIICVN